MQPATPNVAVSEGGGDGGGGDSNPQAMVCIELTSGNLQRSVSVRVMTISSSTATGLFVYTDELWASLHTEQHYLSWLTECLDFI